MSEIIQVVLFGVILALACWILWARSRQDGQPKYRVSHPQLVEIELTDGYYWFVSERSSHDSIAEFVRGEWYLINEVGPVTLRELNYRGWQLHRRVV